MCSFGLVSIITPSYNCARFIGETIESIQAQSYSDWELLITDDCSSDGSPDIIEKYSAADKRIKLFRLDKNSGAGLARNNSIEKASGRFIAFCDSDDRWYPDKLAKQLAFMMSRNCAFSYTSYMTCCENGETNGIVVCPSKVTFKSMLCDDKAGFLTVVYDTRKVSKIYMPSLRKRQDWAWKIKVLKICGFGLGMKEPLAIYRLRQDSLSCKKTTLVKYNIAVYRQILGWSTVRSIVFFAFAFMPHYLIKRYRLKQING